MLLEILPIAADLNVQDIINHIQQRCNESSNLKGSFVSLQIWIEYGHTVILRQLAEFQLLGSDLYGYSILINYTRYQLTAFVFLDVLYLTL